MPLPRLRACGRDSIFGQLIFPLVPKDDRREELTPFSSCTLANLAKGSQLHPLSPDTAALTSTDYW